MSAYNMCGQGDSPGNSLWRLRKKKAPKVRLY